MDCFSVALQFTHYMTPCQHLEESYPLAGRVREEWRSCPAIYLVAFTALSLSYSLLIGASLLVLSGNATAVAASFFLLYLARRYPAQQSIEKMREVLDKIIDLDEKQGSKVSRIDTATASLEQLLETYSERIKNFEERFTVQEEHQKNLDTLIEQLRATGGFSAEQIKEATETLRRECAEHAETRKVSQAFVDLLNQLDIDACKREITEATGKLEGMKNEQAKCAERIEEALKSLEGLKVEKEFVEERIKHLKETEERIKSLLTQLEGQSTAAAITARRT